MGKNSAVYTKGAHDLCAGVIGLNNIGGGTVLSFRAQAYLLISWNVSERRFVTEESTCLTWPGIRLVQPALTVGKLRAASWYLESGIVEYMTCHVQEEKLTWRHC